MKDRYKMLLVMKWLYLSVFLCLTVFLASCNKKNDNSIFYTSDEIYLNCVEYGYVSSDFPEGLLIFESEEQWECALKEYECIGSLAEPEILTKTYPLGEYIYLLNCMDTEFDSKVECKGVRIDETAMTIHLEHKIKSPKEESPAAMKYYITYAVVPKEYWNNYDFSKQQGVLYFGKADIDQTDESGPVKENPENEGGEPPEILNLASFEKIAELKSMLEEEDEVVIDYLDSNHYSMNGLASKSDIAAFFDHVGELTMFHMDPSSGYSLTSILYYPEHDYDFFMAVYSNGSERILFRCFVDTSDGVYVPEEDAVSTLSMGDKKVAFYEIEDEAAYAFVGWTETANSLITIMISEDDEEKMRNTIEGHIVSATFLELVEESGSGE